MSDIDNQYHKQYGSQEQPNEFRLRWQTKQLTADEEAKTTGCGSPEEAFSKLYPEFVSLDMFRHDEWAKEAAAKKAAEHNSPDNSPDSPEAVDAE